MAESDQQSLSISLFDTPFGNEKGQPSLNDLIKKACSDKNFTVLKYILQKSNFVPTEPVDEFGNNILHFIIYNLEDMGGIPFLQTFLANPNVKKIIDKLSKQDGYTPAIAACALHYDAVVNLLKQAGADIYIPSRDGTKIMTATETEVQQEKNEKPLMKPAIDFLSKLSLMSRKDSEIVPYTTTQTPLSTIGMSETQSKPVNNDNISELSTEAFVKGVINGTLAASKPPETPRMFTGGSHSVVVGQRFLNRAPEYSSISGGSSDSEKKKRTTKKKSKRSIERSVSRGSFELGRITDDIHTRTIETIKSLMGVDEETAKAYKSILYYRVKEEHPEMSGYERAVEMEKLATKSILKDIDIDAAKKKRENFNSTSASSSETSTEKKPRKKKSNLSDTSSSELSDNKPKRRTKKSESQSELTSSPELDTNLSM